MKAFKTLLLATTASLATSLAYADCEFPAKVQVPDGSKATTEAMVAGQADVKQFMTDVESYMDCIDKEAVAVGAKELSEEQIRVRDMRHDAAVDEMDKLAADFNAQVRAYKKAGN